MLSSLTQVLTKPADGKAEDGKLAEIPIPEIRKVATYERDYRPHHRASRTYLRNRTFGAPPTDVVEYDLDNDDEDWLTAYNDGQNRLPAEKFEAMIWKLEVRCGEATEIAMEHRATVATEKGQIISYQDKCAAMAGTEALPKENALELLKDEELLKSFFDRLRQVERQVLEHARQVVEVGQAVADPGDRDGGRRRIHRL